MLYGNSLKNSHSSKQFIFVWRGWISSFLLISLSASLATCGSSSFAVILFLNIKSLGRYVEYFKSNWAVLLRYPLYILSFTILIPRTGIQSLFFFYGWRDTHQVDSFSFQKLKSTQLIWIRCWTEHRKIDFWLIFKRFFIIVSQTRGNCCFGVSYTSEP